MDLIQLLGEGTSKLYVVMVLASVLGWLLLLLSIGLIWQLCLVQLKIVFVGRTLQQFPKQLTPCLRIIR